jgi:Lipocalin-like domain
MLRRAALVVLLTCLFLMSSQTRRVRAAAASPLEGAWQVMDVGGTAAAGLYIFTSGNHYSIMFATKDRPQIDDTNKASADELRAVWGPMAANAGTYEVSGSLVTIRRSRSSWLPAPMRYMLSASMERRSPRRSGEMPEASRFRMRTQCISSVWNKSALNNL